MSCILICKTLIQCLFFSVETRKKNVKPDILLVPYDYGGKHGKKKNWWG